MPQVSEISFQFLATQTCTSCQLPVTCGPVYVVDDLSILCGRCRMSAKDHYRNYAYEVLASIFLYPCKNWRNHCPVKLRWNDSLDHESECNYIGCCTFLCTHPGAFLKGKRDLPNDETLLTLVPENLLEHLECVWCRGYLSSSPVFIQSNGQNICHRCIYANGNPPHCRRNHSYETYSQIFVFPCVNKKRGCRERIQFGRGVWKHEAKCEYSPSLARISPTHQDWNGIEEARSSLRPAHDPQRLNARANEPQRSSYRRNQDDQNALTNDVARSSASPTDENPTNVKHKERGIVKTHSGHIWATLTPNTALFAPPDNEHPDANRQLLKSLAKKQGRQIRRADDIGNEMGRRNSESESVSTNESYNMKTSRTSTPESLEPPRRPYIPPEDYTMRNGATDSRPNSRESGYQTSPRYQEEPRLTRGSRATDSFRGQYPVLTPHQLSDSYESDKRLSYRESGRGNPLLISELKIKQDIIKRTHSIKGERDANSPYKQCNNLDDIMEVNRRLR